ncbi:MAG TPA: protein translocase subunit SecD [Vicinamibacterales bacterium]
MKNLRWKLVVILAVVVLSVVAFWPPFDQGDRPGKVRLGLDLKGGVHMVLRVQTDDALRLETEMASERFRETLRSKGINGVTVTPQPPTRIQITGVPPAQDAAFRQVADAELGPLYNRSGSAASGYTFEMKPNMAAQLRDQAVQQALQTVERRVNALGVAEPIVAPHGTSGDQILVQLPGVQDPQQVKTIIGSTALLELKIVEAGPASSQEALLQPYNGQVPPEMEVVTGADRTNPGATSYYLVRRVAPVTGRDLRTARPTIDENGLPAVGFSMNREGAIKFSRLTSENIGRPLAVILDNQVQTVATIQGRIADEGQIYGSFTQQEVADMALMLRSGALPASLTYLEERTVGPTLGADSIRAGIAASLSGLALVALFMLVYYKLSGINAIVSVALNLVILLGFMAYIGAAMTLPGVAGFILTIGMGVDSNVLIFERIKEELAAGKGPRAAVQAGFDRVFWTILDTHVASLIAAGFLFQFGTGPIRGFATTLFFGLLANVFTAVFVSRTLFELVLSRRAQPQTLSI